MTTKTRMLTLPDGRDVDVFVGGAPDGFAVVMHHGTPSDATTFADWEDSCRSRGIRLICVSRGGYATSERLAGRDVAHAATASADVLDQLGIGEFVTLGWSGGGPHALACGALLPDRCLAAATLAGVGPYGMPDLDFLSGMGQENIDEFGAAVAGESALRAWMIEFGEPFRRVTAPEIAEALGGLVPQIDVDVLNDGYAEQLASGSRRALQHGLDGWIDDDLAFTQAWGFDVSDIDVPVTVWQGDLDLMVPFAHGTWLVDHIPGAAARMVTGHGHISLGTRHREVILDDLTRYIPGSGKKQTNI